MWTHYQRRSASRDTVKSLELALGIVAQIEQPRGRKQRVIEQRPSARVLDDRGRIKPHPYEPPHDVPDPGSGPCWECVKPRGHKVHRVQPGAT